MVDYDYFREHINEAQRNQYSQYQQGDRYGEQHVNYNAYSHQNRYYQPSNSYDYPSSRYYDTFDNSAIGSSNGFLNKWLNMNSRGNIYHGLSFSWAVCIAIVVIIFFHYRDYSRKFYQQDYYEIDQSFTWHERVLDYMEYLGVTITSFFNALYRVKVFILPQSTNTRTKAKINDLTIGESTFRKRGIVFPNLSGKVPPLEDTSIHPVSGDKNNEGDLAPAFFSDEEYPNAWLTFDDKAGKIVPFKRRGDKTNKD